MFFGLLLLMMIEYIGLAKDIPVLKVTKFSTLLAYGLMLVVIVRVGPKALVEYPQSKALLGFVFFTGFSIFYAVIRSYVPTEFRSHIDYFGLYLCDRLFRRSAKAPRHAVDDVRTHHHRPGGAQPGEARTVRAHGLVHGGILPG